MGEREREQRVVHTVPPGTVEHPTDDVIGLDVSAALEVAQHRGAPRAGRIRQSGSGEVQPRRARRMPFARRNLGVGGKRPLHGLATAGRADDFAHVCAEQTCHRCQRSEKHQLVPEYLLDVIGE